MLIDHPKRVFQVLQYYCMLGSCAQLNLAWKCLLWLVLRNLCVRWARLLLCAVNDGPPLASGSDRGGGCAAHGEGHRRGEHPLTVDCHVHADFLHQQGALLLAVSIWASATVRFCHSAGLPLCSSVGVCPPYQRQRTMPIAFQSRGGCG